MRGETPAAPRPPSPRSCPRAGGCCSATGSGRGRRRAALGGLGAEPDELGDLDGLLDAVRGAGLEVVEVQTATREEWDAFESAWRAGLERLDDPRARALAEDRRAGYEQGYRGELGFAFVLGLRGG